MDLYHTTDMDGISMLNPDVEKMRDLLAQLDDASTEEADHPDVSLIHDPSGWSLSVFPNGTVTIENFDAEDSHPLYMKDVSKKDALQMWQDLSRGKIEKIRKHPWIAEGI